MKCKVCEVKMVIRTGPYGNFFACPNSFPGNNHGTVSVTPKDSSNFRSYPNISREDESISSGYGFQSYGAVEAENTATDYAYGSGTVESATSFNAINVHDDDIPNPW